MFLLIGQYHPDLLAYFDEHGYAYATLLDRKRYDTPEAVDFSDWDSVVKAARNLPEPPTVIFSLYEQYIPAAARLSEQFGLAHSLPQSAALAATDKLIMRRSFQNALEPISTPYTEVTSDNDATAFAKAYGFPVYLKPANLSKSLLVQRCEDMTELRTALRHARSQSANLYKRYAADRSPRFIIEKGLDGSIHTIAGFMDEHGEVSFAPGIVDNMSAASAGFDDTFIFRRMMPSELDESSQKSLFTCAEQAAKSLGLRSCPFHAELILTSDGPRVIEVGARLGGYRSRMYGTAYGIDLVGAALDAYAGMRVSLTNNAHQAVAVYEFFPKQPGTLHSIGDLEAVQSLESFSHLGLFKELGAQVGRAADGFKAVGSLTLSHSDLDTLKQDQVRLESLIDIVTV